MKLPSKGAFSCEEGISENENLPPLERHAEMSRHSGKFVVIIIQTCYDESRVFVLITSPPVWRNAWTKSTPQDRWGRPGFWRAIVRPSQR